MGCVYKITNKINGQIYIGKTKGKLKDRWYSHLYSYKKGKNIYLYNAMRKYGVENFGIETLIDGIETNIELNDIEKYYISFYNTFKGEGYNLTKGGDGGNLNNVIKAINTMKNDIDKNGLNGLQRKSIKSKKTIKEKNLQPYINKKYLNQKKEKK